MNRIPSTSPETGSNRPTLWGKVRNLIGQTTVAASAIINGANLHAEEKPQSEHKEKPKMTMVEAKVTTETRVVRKKLKDVLELEGLQCGDGRNEKGVTAFGGELMGIAYPILKQIEESEGRELKEDEIADFLKDYPGILVMHTDEHGLTHLVEEIQKHPVLKRFFTDKDYKEIVEKGLLTDRVQELLRGEHDEEIAEGLTELGAHLQCQGCGHVKTVLGEEDKPDPPDRHPDHLSDNIVQYHVGQHLKGSKHHQIVRYPGEHEEKGVIVLKTKEELDSEDDLVPALTPKGNRESFYIHPQVTDFRLRQIADYATKKFPKMAFTKDTDEFKKGAIARQQKQMAITAHRLAEGFPVFISTLDEKGNVTVEPSGKIE